jgi:hypothetical protein
MEVAMKKFIFTLGLLLCATTSLFSAVHIPAAAWIGDNMPIANPNQRGTIMQIILNNPDYEEERAAIRTFLNIQNNNQMQNISYQSIVTQLKNTPAYQAGALETIEAFERAIMHHLHTQNYITYIENKWINIFVTGIRWAWVNPTKWIRPSYWYSDNSLMLQQAMQELSTFATIADNHSIITGSRIRATVESYLHWRRNLTAAIAVYLAGNLAYNGWEKSSLKMLKNGGVKNIGKVIHRASKEIIDFTSYSSKKISTTAKSIGDSMLPLMKAILYGDETDSKNSPPKNEIKNKNEQSTWSAWKNYNAGLYEKFLAQNQTAENI